MKNYYYILGLEKGASVREIKAAYRKLSLKIHPDVNSNDDFFTNYSKEINEAYKVLSDPSRKKVFDKTFKDFEKRSFSFLDFEEKYSNLENREKEINKREKQVSEREYYILTKEKEVDKKSKSLFEKENQLKTKEKRYYRSKRISIFSIVTSIVFITIFLIFSNRSINSIYKTRIENLESTIENNKNELDKRKTEIEKASILLSDKDNEINNLVNTNSELKDNNSILLAEISQQEKNHKKEIQKYQNTNTAKKNSKSQVASGTKWFNNKLKVINHEHLEIVNAVWEWAGFEGSHVEIYRIEKISLRNKSNKTIYSCSVEFTIKDSNGNPIDSGSEKSGYYFESIEPGKTKTMKDPFDIPSKRNSQIMEIKIVEVNFEKKARW